MNKLFNTRLAIATALLAVTTAASAQKSGTEKAGDIIQVLVPLTAYSSTFYKHDPKGRDQFYKSFLTNLGMTYALKLSVNKRRPENNGDYSFPSGHTSAAFQGAAFIQKRYGWNYGLPAYAAASYVGWSRVEGESDKHDIVDVAAGAAIGIFSSYYFTQPYKNATVAPLVGNKTYGLIVSMDW